MSHLHACCLWSLLEGVASPGTVVTDDCKLSELQIELPLQPSSLKIFVLHLYIYRNKYKI